MTKYTFGAKHLVFAVAGVVAAGLMIANDQALAQALVSQTTEEITVTGPRTVHRTPTGRKSMTGAPVEEVTLMRRVSYAGLNLNDPMDVKEFERRIHDTAKEACSQLDTLYPENLYPRVTTDKECMKEAVNGGMAQAEMVIKAVRK